MHKNLRITLDWINLPRTFYYLATLTQVQRVKALNVITRERWPVWRRQSLPNKIAVIYLEYITAHYLF
jgi:hypothetical protein